MRALVDLAYLAASVLFILTFKGLSHPRSAVRANQLGAVGMLIAVVATLLLLDWGSGAGRYWVVFAGLAAGAVAGAVMAQRVRMTAMPQMVALLNGFGGAASALVAGAALLEELAQGRMPGAQFSVATVASGLIGAVTFWGSLVAWGKLEERLPGRPVAFPGQRAANVAMLVAALLLGAWLVARPDAVWLYVVIVLLGSVASSNTEQIAVEARESGIPLITPASTNDTITVNGGPLVSRICFKDSFQGAVVAKQGQRLAERARLQQLQAGERGPHGFRIAR